MSRSRKIVELPEFTEAKPEDLLILESVEEASSTTGSIRVGNLKNLNSDPSDLVGSIWYDENFLYIRISESLVKKAELQDI